MIIKQSYAICKLYVIMQDLAERLGAEYSSIEYNFETIPDGEIHTIGHDERYVCLKVAHGIELSTWKRMWGRNIEEASYRLDVPTDEAEINHIVIVITGLCERLLKNPYMSLFDAVFIPETEV